MHLICEITSNTYRPKEIIHLFLKHVIFWKLTQHKKTDRSSQIKLRSYLKDEASAELFDSSVIILEEHFDNAFHIEIAPAALLSHL